MEEDEEDIKSILSIEFYLSLEKQREAYYQNQINQYDPLERDRQTNLVNKTHHKNSLSLIEETEHIQNKAFFDAINQAMNIY